MFIYTINTQGIFYADILPKDNTKNMTIKGKEGPQEREDKRRENGCK